MRKDQRIARNKASQEDTAKGDGTPILHYKSSGGPLTAIHCKVRHPIRCSIMFWKLLKHFVLVNSDELKSQFKNFINDSDNALLLALSKENTDFHI